MANNILLPSFGSSIIEQKREDGYWVETFHMDKNDPVPGVVCSGLVSCTIEFLDNPIAAARYQERKSGSAPKALGPETLQEPWHKYEVGKFDSPVAIAVADVMGNGLMDIFVCHTYGKGTMLECDPEGGHIHWLRNPGRDKLKDGEHWEQRYVGRWPSMHRMRAGYFTQTSVLELVAASIVRGPHDKAGAVPVLLYKKPENVLEAEKWEETVIDGENYTCIHEVTKLPASKTNGDLDRFLVSSREGLTIFSYDVANKRWNKDLVGTGEAKKPWQTPTSEAPGTGDYWGTGTSDVGKIGDDPTAYIATLDPFHGITACVYTKDKEAGAGSKSKPKWKRHVLDTYGNATQRFKFGDGPGHFIVCADFDGDGDDEWLLSLFGPLERDDNGTVTYPAKGAHPDKGIMYYKAIDLDKGIFAKWRIVPDSSARIAIGDFADTGRIDLVSVSYNVRRYYEESNPVVRVHPNKFAPQPKEAGNEVLSTVWDNEVLVYLPHPSKQKSPPFKAPLIDIANYAINVEVYPPGHDIPLSNPGAGLKVLYGSINLTKDGDSSSETRRPFSVDPFTAKTTTTGSYNKAKADAKLGAVILRLNPLVGPESESKSTPPFESVYDIPVHLTAPLPPVLGPLKPQVQFQKVTDLWWGQGFADNFHNLSGIRLDFLTAPDSSSSSSSSPPEHMPLAHLQFWAAGTKVDCGVHNHSQDSFCEIHVALSAGTGNGGMDYLKSGEDAKFEHLPLEELQEHGGFWQRNADGTPKRRGTHPGSVAVQYPWHKWQAGDGRNMDVWMAIEFDPWVADADAGQK